MASSAPMYHFFVVCLWHGLAGSGDAPMVRVKCFIANASCSSWDSAIIRYNIRRLLDAIWLLISLYNARLCIALLPPPPAFLPYLYTYIELCSSLDHPFLCIINASASSRHFGAGKKITQPPLRLQDCFMGLWPTFCQ
jgi:hypothetical protein